MRFSVASGSGQVLAYGRLLIQTDESGALRLCFESDRGTFIEGGEIGEDGDLTEAGKELYQRFFQTWGMMGLTMTSIA